MKSLLVFVFLGLCGAAFAGWPTRRHCNPDPCRNSGRCISWFYGYFCWCSASFEGRHCESRKTFTCNGYRNRGPCFSRFWTRQVDKFYPMEDPTMYIECQSGECLEQSCPHKMQYIPELFACLPMEDEDDQGGQDNTEDEVDVPEDDEGGKSTGKSTGKKSKKSGSKEDNEDDEGGVDKSTGKSSKKSQKDPEDDEGGAKSSGKSSKKSKKDPEDDEGKKGGKKDKGKKE